MNNSYKRFLLIAICSIVLLASYLRLFRIDEYLTFLGDEGRDVLRVKQMLVDGDLIFLGPTASVGGFFLGPMYYYFMTPFLWLWNYDPTGPAVMVALFGVATVYLVYFVGSKMFHPIVGISAATLYALSPVVISLSRSSWNPNIVPFFSLLLMYLLWRLALQQRLLWYFCVGIIFGLGIQFHYLFSFPIVISAIWLVTFARPIKQQLIKAYGLVIIGFLIAFSPLILFELVRNFPNLRAMVNFFLSGNETGFQLGGFLKTIADVSFRSFGRLLYRMPNYDVWNTYPQWQISVIRIVTTTTLLSGLGLVVSLVLSQLKKRKQLRFPSIQRVFPISKEQWLASVLVMLWFGGSVILFGFYRRGIYDYYFGIFFAIPFLLLGIIFWQMAKTKIGMALALIAFVAISYFNWAGRPFVYQPNRQMKQTADVARAVVEMAGDKPYNFAFITATNSDHAYRYFLEIWQKPPVKIEQITIDPERKTVTEQLIVMCENPSCEPLGNPLWDVAGFGRAEIVEERDVFPVRLFKLTPFTEVTTE